MKKKIFLTGATGKLGSTLTPYLEKKYNLFPVGFKIKPKGGVKINLTQSINVKNILNKIKPDIIIHLAAMTNVDYCEENSKKAFLCAPISKNAAPKFEEIESTRPS